MARVPSRLSSRPRLARPALRGVQVALALILSAGLSGCVQPRSQMTAPPVAQPPAVLDEAQIQALLREEVARQDQLYRISTRLFARANAAGFCPPTLLAAEPGFLHWNGDVFGPDNRGRMQQLFGLNERMVVRAVVPDSPAAQAGLMAGDPIVQLGGRPVPGDAAGYQQALDADLADGSLEFTTERNGQSLRAVFPPQAICAFQAVLSDQPPILLSGLAQDGSGQIVVTTAMMQAMASEPLLAAALAYPVAEAILRSGLGMGGPDFAGEDQRLGLPPGTTRRDLMVLQLLNAAGYPAESLDQFWQRLAQEPPARLGQGFVLPYPPERAGLLGSLAASLPRPAN